MLTKATINNFKAWKSTGKIEFAPLTVFFGANSSGKTSINQFLLMLKQTAQSPDRQQVLHTGDERTPIELGTPYDIVFDHDLSNGITFKLGWRLSKPLEVTDPRTEASYESNEIEFSSTLALENGKSPRLAVREMSYALGDPDAGGLLVGMQPHPKQKDKYDLSFKGYSLVRNEGRPWGLPAPIRFYGFPDEASAYYKNSGFLADLTLALEQLLGSIHYLGPLRAYPKPSYTWSGEVPTDVGWSGDRAVPALLAARHRKISRGYKKFSRPFEQVVALWLKEMRLIDKFEVRQIAKHRKDYEVRVRTAGTSQLVRLMDVGFGVSQVLPVIVQCFYLPRRSIMVFEQPEIHLHPSVQASLADLFIEAIHAREGSADREVQIIVESHSEHFLRRLQRRIAEERITSEEVAIYVCEAGRAGASLSRLEVDMFGNILNWPEGFFGDEIGELTAMTEAAMKRRQRDQG